MPSITVRASEAASRREAVAHKVLDAVERLLAEGSSFTELSIKAIADEAGMGRSTFYSHFADKTELLMRLAESATTNMFAETNRWLASTNKTEIGTLPDSIERIIAEYREHQHVFAALLAATGYDPEIEEFWHGHIQQLALSGTETLNRARATRHLGPDVDIEQTATMIAWSLERTVSMHSAHRPQSEDQTLATTIARVIWLAIFGDTRSNC